jgi:GNAT superfamily N-acetyltransferase
MQFRPARPSDVEAISDVARESWHAAYGDFLSTVTIDETVDAWYDPADLREQLAEGAFVVAVDEVDGVVAFAHAVVGGDGTRPTLTRLYAREAYWGSGVGTRLLNRVVAALDTDPSHDSLSRSSSSRTTRSGERSTRPAASRWSAAGPRRSTGTTTRS